MTLRACDHCSKNYDAKRPNSKFCGASCRKRNQRNPQGAKVSALPVAPPPEALVITLLDVVRRELTDAGRLETIEGMQAVTLAQRMLDPFSTAASVATLNKELSVVLARALAGTKQAEPDLLDELEQRRLAKANEA